MESQENIWTLTKRHALSPEEIERRKQGAQRLKERLSHMPFYKMKEQRSGPEYWDRLYASQVNT
jgi:hypothetical protein